MTFSKPLLSRFAPPRYQSLLLDPISSSFSLLASPQSCMPFCKSKQVSSFFAEWRPMSPCQLGSGCCCKRDRVQHQLLVVSRCHFAQSEQRQGNNKERKGGTRVRWRLVGACCVCWCFSSPTEYFVSTLSILWSLK